MSRLLAFLLIVSSFILPTSSFGETPLRVFIHSGPKSHRLGAHEHPSFLKDWVHLLNERGAQASGGNDFPTQEQLKKMDVLIIHRNGGGNFKPEERAMLDEYTRRGGGIVAIHAGTVSDTPEGTDYYKSLIGGSWRRPDTKFFEGPLNLYFTDRENPVTKDMSNFELEDEIYYDMDLSPDIKVLAAAYTPKPKDARKETAGSGNKVSVYDIQPQVWTYERSADTPVRAPSPGGEASKSNDAGKSAHAPFNYRAFVCIPGHYYKNFSHPVMRALILRGIAWAGKRSNTDELCKPDELGDNLRYVEGGPTRPEKAAEKLEVHPEFNISLVASEPLVNKVMNVDWDEKGRLWVCETPEYPNGRRKPNVERWKESGSWSQNTDRNPIDRISWLEDTNGDGLMDKKHVFADKLELVTSLCFYKNGVIACAAPDIWFLEDTDGDGACDKRTKLYTGLGNGDTHAVMNNLRWGLDGWVYATHGYSAGDVTVLGRSGFQPDNGGHPDRRSKSDPAGSQTQTGKMPILPASSPVRIGSGVVRFKPDGTAIEQYSSKGGNTWGLCMTWDGQCFWTQPTSGTVFFHTVLPESVLAKGKIPGTTSWKGMITGQRTYPLINWPEQAYVQIDQVGRFTAAAGCAIYEGGAWPDKWNYSYFTTEPTLNIVHHQFVEKDGVSYQTHKESGREETEFIRSKDLWFRPIETRVGPDGAIYVVDFYNQAVIHNDTRGPQHGPASAAVRPDRDHYFSRIWKVQHKEAKRLQVPVLDKMDKAGLLAAIKTSPNAHVKLTASRLLAESSETGKPETISKNESHRINPVPTGSDAYKLYLSTSSRLHLNPPKNTKEESAKFNKGYEEALTTFLNDGDNWTRTAIVAAAAGQSRYSIENGIWICLQHPEADKLGPLVSALASASLQETGAASLVHTCAAAPARADGLKKIILETIAQQSQAALGIDSTVADALKKLLANPATAGAALPLVAKWDTKGVLAKAVKSGLAKLSATLADAKAPVADRINAARALISAGGDTLQFVVPPLGGQDSPAELQSAIIQSLGETGQSEILVANYDRLKAEQRSSAFDQILKRTEATQSLLVAISEGKIKAASLSPSDVARLRTHANKQIAKQANVVLDQLISPATKEKNTVIAKLTPEVQKPGNTANGKMLFTAACATCHKLGDIGKDVAPPLAGMGAHGPAELLVHVVDPNREVDPSFFQWNITKKNGDIFVGVISSENRATLTLKNQTGDYEIRKDDIKTRENTNRSLMPEGFEALGAETLRDILAFICASETRFRIVELKNACTADTRRGLFASEEAVNDTVHFSKFGNITAQDVPWFIQDPAKRANGTNIIVLKGGSGKAFAQSFPQRVEIAMNTPAKQLHFLSGIAGWGFPATSEKLPALKVTMTHADGQSETIELKNGEAFADYNKVTDVPGSNLVEGVVSKGQLRRITLPVKNTTPITKLTLESYNNEVAPVVCAITADLEGSAGTPARNQNKIGGDAAKNIDAGKGARAPDINWESGKTKVLIISGGSSHNFTKFFGETDGATLKASSFATHYTEDSDQAVAGLINADVAIISTNKKGFDSPAYRKALMAFAESGKGIIMLHPGTWYGFDQWPELNAKIVGGGARGHDSIDKFTISVLKKDHPVMKDVPESFTVEDELYYINAEPDKIPANTAPIEVLAQTSPSKKYKTSHPAVWTTKHDKAKIAGIAIGHDERVHNLEAFKIILINAVKWTSGK